MENRRVKILLFYFFWGGELVLMACDPKKWVKLSFPVFSFCEGVFMAVTVIRTGRPLYVVLPRNLTYTYIYIQNSHV